MYLIADEALISLRVLFENLEQLSMKDPNQGL
jgi:hypothetical protein